MEKVAGGVSKGVWGKAKPPQVLTRCKEWCMVEGMTMTMCRPEDLINITQAAEMLGVSRPTIYELIRRGELTPVEIAGLSYLDRGEVESLKQKRNNESI